MNATTATVTTWRVVGYREAAYQACPGGPVQPGGCCENCGQGIRYVVTVQDDATGRRMDVGRDCAVTLEGGPDLAAIRRAEREWEHAQYLASPEYAERKVRAEALEAMRNEARSAAPVRYALELAVLADIRASVWVTDNGKATAQQVTEAILDGRSGGADSWDDDRREHLANDAFRAYLPAPKHHEAAVGVRVRCVICTLVRTGSFQTEFGTTFVETFVCADGSTLVWKGKGAFVPNEGYSGTRPVAIGERVLLTGTVKGHGEYRGMPQTNVTRCKVSPA
jgi:hypothetical protein